MGLRPADWIPAFAPRGSGIGGCPAAAVLLVVASLLSVACDPNRGAQVSFDFPPTPAEHREGEAAFELHCSLCHGSQALGSEMGPALVHEHYAPSHHADQAFEIAVRQGVQAHHWRFGNMPPQPHVTQQEIERITAYVRWLQRQAGIE